MPDEKGRTTVKMTRRQMLATSAVLAALAGCARLEPGPASRGPGGSPGGPKSATPTPSPSPTPVAAFLPEGPVNVLIAGSDSRTSDLYEDGRSDVICVAQLSANRERINLVSIARDTIATMPGGAQSKINDAYAIGGIQGLAEAVAGQLGDLPIHYTLETGFIWFTEITQLLGGFTVENRFESDSSGPRFEAGKLRLQGEDALTYARERKGLPNGDLDRTERHRACLTGIVVRLAELANADNGFTNLVTKLWTKVRPERVDGDDILTMITIVKAMSADSISSAMLPVASFADVAGMSVDIIDIDRAAELIEQLHAGDIAPYQAKYGLDTAPTGGRG